MSCVWTLEDSLRVKGGPELSTLVFPDQGSCSQEPQEHLCGPGRLLSDSHSAYVPDSQDIPLTSQQASEASASLLLGLSYIQLYSPQMAFQGK